ncbi:MAG: hypothetical protein AB2A00_06550 [Myxococcota bacterium]
MLVDRRRALLYKCTGLFPVTPVASWVGGWNVASGALPSLQLEGVVMTLTAKDAGVAPLTMWRDVYRVENAARQLEAIRSLAPQFKKEFLASGPVVAVRSLRTSLAPYPVTYAFNRACSLPYPYMLFQNRALVVQFRQQGVVKTLLMNPTIPERSLQAPFFQQLYQRIPFVDAIYGLLKPQSLPDQLRGVGIAPEQIDYVAFDHQHVQDMRPFLGTTELPPLYPRALFLVQRADYESSVSQHPLQRPWFVPGAGDDVKTDRLVLLDGDVQLGNGAALLFTPGHTYGNQSLLFHAPHSGCYTVSENGVCMDNYAPQHSSIPGLADHATRTGEEVILNGNTREDSLRQYNSMVKEKLLADVYRKDTRFAQHYSSSELVHTPVAPLLRPTHSIGDLSEGELQTVTAASSHAVNAA